MPEGKVKWFDAKKGYGFIIDEEGEDVFVHFTAIECKRKYRTLDDGDRVEYELIKDEKGKKADFVRVIEE
jgi:CspA family cold shock protein